MGRLEVCLSGENICLACSKSRVQSIAGKEEGRKERKKRKKE
jgi:hypothetical protein